MNNIKLNKLLNEKYMLLKGIAKKFNYSDELLVMITLTYVAFYMSLGKDCDVPLYDLFNNVQIIYEEGNVNEIAIRHDLGPMPQGSVAVTAFIPNLKLFKDATQKQYPQAIILGTHVGNNLATPALKLEMLIHEVRHALMGYYNSHLLIDENTYYMRSGLHETYYFRDDNAKEKFSSKGNGTTLDEITNTYITELLVNKIMSFKENQIKNNKIRLYIDTLKTAQADKRYRAIGYNTEVRLLYPLLLNEEFVNLVNKCQFYGNINLIKEFLENNIDSYTYDEFCQMLDEIFELEGKCAKNNNPKDTEEFVRLIKKVKVIIIEMNKKLLGSSRNLLKE